MQRNDDPIRAFKDDVPEESYTVPIGEAKVVKEGSDVTVISYGAMLRTTMKALEEMPEVNPEIIDLRTLSPLDTATIIKSVQKTGRAVVVNEAPKHIGFAAEIAALINEKALLSLQAPVKRITGWDIPMPFAKSEDFYLPNAYRIKKGVKEVMGF